MKGVVIGLVLLAVACGSDDTSGTAPLTKCEEAMRTAAMEIDSAKADPLIEATLTACTTTNQWVAALFKFPAALGIAEGVGISDLDIQVACHGHEATPMCVDAEAKGKLP